MSKQAHHFPIRIYFEDTDAGGIVYYANYLKFMERARTEMLRDHGMDHAAMIRDLNVMFVVRAVKIEYLKPALLDDACTVVTRIAQMGNASVTLQQEVKKDEVTLASAEIVLVSITKAGAVCRIPATIRAKMETLVSNPLNLA